MPFFNKYKELKSLQSECKSIFKRFIAFTRISNDDETLFLSATDGINVWRVEISEDDITDHYVKLSKTSSADTFIAYLISAFDSGDLEVSICPQKVTLMLGKEPTSTTNFDLFETSMQHKQDEIQHFIFTSAETISSLKQELKDANDSLQSMEVPAEMAETSAFSPFKEQEPRKAKIARPKQGKGHSIINPGIKRKQAAKGVVFE